MRQPLQHVTRRWRCLGDPFSVCLSGLMAVWCLTAPAAAGDWPQILGPHRDGIAENESLAGSWPEDGPPTLWQRDVGSGLAGVAVADGTVVLFHRVGDVERVEAMDARTGDVLWTADFPATYVPRFVNDDGPRCVPVVEGDRVYVYGAKGGLRCLDLTTGEKLWTRNTFEDYSSKRPVRGEPPEGYFGIGSTPLVEGDKLLVNVGGHTKDAGIVAFDRTSGRTVWTATDERASYSAPKAATVDGVRHVIFAARFHIVSVDPDNGDVRFRIPFGRPGANVTAATPLVFDDHLFVSAAYGFGAVLARIEGEQAEVLWRSDEVLSTHYTTCILHEGNLYGIHGRQDVGVAKLRCFDPSTREIHWTEDGFGYATLIRADGKLLILKTDGQLVLAEPTPERYHELDRARIAHKTTRALPALSNGRLYVRDTDTLKCIDLRIDEPQ